MRKHSPVRLIGAAIAASAVLATAACSSGSDQGANGSVELANESRQAAGDITANGGARRISGDQTDAVRDAITNSKAKNVILLIGDGMGDSEITAARNVAEGAGGSFKGIDALPLTGQYTTYALDKKTGKPDYVPDSAATGTAWATGTKSYNGAVGVDVQGNAQANLLEIAKANGLATGNVTTSEIQDATPAVLAAHVSQRKCYGPEVTTEKCPENALELGGAGSITEQLIETRADVVLGGGAKTFDERAKAGEHEGKTLFEQADARGYSTVRTLDELKAVTAANQDAPLLGLFAPGNMEVRWQGEVASQGGIEGPAQTCTDNTKRDPATSPTLADMTDKAIELLKSNDKGTENGFFLQVEGASIDKQNHGANPCGQIGETIDLDEAVQKAMAFAEQDGDTLVIVTADHAHTSQIVALDTKSPALTSRLTTADGGEMGILYGTGETPGEQGHTGAQLRVAAYGPWAANVVGLTDQTDLFFTMSDALGLDPSKK
ncbi:alkaline phosphatase [Tomitella biformata]|uniref:alkaline phosphatase n=1 Tax=Tomitella biformata TaxID=630403 RepID=UPI000464B062|nr:alkaline phosphatase [Tomitella biformata]